MGQRPYWDRGRPARNKREARTRSPATLRLKLFKTARLWRVAGGTPAIPVKSGPQILQGQARHGQRRYSIAVQTSDRPALSANPLAQALAARV